MCMKHSWIYVLVILLVGCGRSAEVSQYMNGYPSREGNIDIRKGFVNPPPGYGNVPFYWWSGDSLDINRLQEQLDLLSDASTSGLCVSYHHTHADVEVELNAQGHGFCGRVQGGAPRVLSEEWFKVWNDFSKRCARKGIGLGMDDYVVAWTGNGEYIDSILALPEIKDYQGRLDYALVNEDDTTSWEHVVCRVPKEDTHQTYVVFTHPSPELHPSFGLRLIEYYFEPFVKHMDEEGLKGMNYFFQDELDYQPSLHSWCEDMPEEFLNRKGYDIRPLLPALFVDWGEQTAKVRLDYAEVVTQLAEERYFQPIYDWHAGKGLIYGSDNLGRGLNPLQYMDYFRAEKWFTAPGNDAPARGSSFTQTKVSSSIAHMYQRPRTWLEAFHSMGWDANGALLTYQLDHHLIAGGNLLCMHGLYYSTHGGWWEWAPPSFHFRMPYWPHMKVWLQYAERLCFLLSQGVHVADVAVLYPTETLQALPGSSPQPSFNVLNALSPHGCDIDFVDYASLQQAEIRDSTLIMAGESYKVLVLADTRALHEETLAKIEAFAEAGGVVIGIGSLMPELQACVSLIQLPDDFRLLDEVSNRIVRDFQTSSGEGRVLHRRIADDDVYMVMDVPEGDSLFFRSHGKVELWDAQHGTMKEIAALRSDENGTWIRRRCDKNVSELYVFSPGEVLYEKEDAKTDTAAIVQPVEGNWQLTVLPTMDNKWGDYRLPATSGCIGVEARSMQCTFLPAQGEPVVIGENVYGYGSYMDLEDEKAGKQPYPFSWQYGVFDSPGSQGYHGLKARVDSRFLLLDKGGRQTFTTRVFAPATDDYRVQQEGVAPDSLFLDGSAIADTLAHLTVGWHDLRLIYLHTTEKPYTLTGMRSYTLDKRDRSMVAFYPKEASDPQEVSGFAPIVASKWFSTAHLAYDTHGGETGEWQYVFQTAPGTCSMTFNVNGTVKGVWVDDRQVSDAFEGEKVVSLSEVNKGISTVKVIAEPSLGCPGSAFFEEPVAMTCRGGEMPLGDWTLWGAMRYYSGGVKYVKEINIDKQKGQKVLIDLGEVDATCEVAVNGKPVDVVLSKPCLLDITRQTKKGKNRIEVLVYSSLANHYQTIPSPYKGTPHAGLIGPVNIILQ